MVKIPFRLQVTEYDCAPITFVNALVYLFERPEIPPIVLQRIYSTCLDGISYRGELACGTSDLAVQLLGQWLSEYRDKRAKFAVEATYVAGKSVHLRKGSELISCLNSGGLSLLSITHYRDYLHYVLALYIDDGWLYAFDPYPKTQRSNRPGYEFIESKDLHSPNIRITE